MVENKLKDVNENELSEAKQESIVDGAGEVKSVNDRAASGLKEARGPHGAGTVRSVNDRAATASADSPEELDGEGENVAGAELGYPNYADPSQPGDVSRKRSVLFQNDPTGDRFTSTEAKFGSTEAPMDIYPEDARKFSEDADEPKDPDILESVQSERDYDALLQANKLNREDMVKAVRIVAKNVHISPDGPTDMFGTPLQKPTDPEEAFGESRVAVPAAEFDTNRVRRELPPSGPARRQEEAESAVEEQREKATEAFDVLDRRSESQGGRRE